MADAASQAKLRALAEYFRNGGQDPRVAKAAMGQPDNTGNLSAAPPIPIGPAQNVPQWAMTTGSQPQGHSAVGSLDDLAAAHAAQLQQNNLASQPQEQAPDLSGYAPYVPPVPGPRQFPAIKKTVSAKSANPNQDLENSTSPGQALTPEQEEALNKKMQDDDDDEEKKQFAANNNNRAGSAEGSYGP